jgi:prophage DNA circulation protein
VNDILRDRLLRKLDLMPEDKLNQVLDFIDFLDSKYAPKIAQSPNAIRSFAEGVESTLRAGKVSASAISGTMNMMNKAVGAISEVAAAGKSVATGLMGAASSSGGPADVEAVVPPEIPRGGPHELGSKLPHTDGEKGT